MKIVEKQKEKPRTLADLDRITQEIGRHLQEECGKCEGTGEPKTKTGKPPISGMGNVKCHACGGTGVVGSRLSKIESDIDKIRKEVNRIGTSLRAHINKQSVEIRVLPEGSDPSKQGKGGWEDYSGIFRINSEEEESIVVGKARYHFETYFQDAVYHRNKKLGLFLSSGSTSGKRLIEEMETGD